MKKILIISLVLYLLSAVGSFAAFSYFSTGQITPQPDQVSEDQTTEDEDTLLTALLSISPDEPRDQVCPLNGKYFTQTEKNAWEQRRPLAVMIENSPDARPQSGLGNADVVFEAIAEGGVTRFMGVFYCNAQAYDITLAPIRSARTYFIDWASSYNRPLYVHVGGANTPGPADALGQLGDYGWNGENDLNQFSVGYPTFVRNFNRVPGKEVATEHTMETTTELLWKYAKEERDWTNMSPERKVGRTVVPAQDWQEDFTPWTFESEATEGTGGTTVAFEFWDGFKQYAVKWEYNQSNGLYKRTMANEPHLDHNTDKQIMAANAIVLFTEEKGPIDELKHMLYKTTGTGDALIFKNGEAIEATWTKRTREAPLLFTDGRGNDIELARGLTWISVVDESTTINYE